MIFQDFVRYDLPVRENIGFGQLDCLDDSERIERAAEAGGALQLVRSLPHGFDTVLGKEFDEGSELSGGEWQKVAIARAYAHQPRIIFADEPTGSLDRETAGHVLESLLKANAAHDTALILVTHDPAVAARMSRSLTLDGGTLA